MRYIISICLTAFFLTTPSVASFVGDEQLVGRIKSHLKLDLGEQLIIMQERRALPRKEQNIVARSFKGLLNEPIIVEIKAKYAEKLRVCELDKVSADNFADHVMQFTKTLLLITLVKPPLESYERTLLADLCGAFKAYVMSEENLVNLSSLKLDHDPTLLRESIASLIDYYKLELPNKRLEEMERLDPALALSIKSINTFHLAGPIMFITYGAMAVGAFVLFKLLY
jgi:hypothetical protein